MSCEDEVCHCGFLKSGPKRCKDDGDCKDCKLNVWLVVAVAVAAAIGLGLIFWGLREEHLAKRRGAVIRELLGSKLGATNEQLASLH